MTELDDITYTLFFGIIPNDDGSASSVRLAYVWDSIEGKMISDFLPSEDFIENAEAKFKQMTWEYTLDEDGQVVEESGYCYYYSSKPDKVVCSNDLSR